MQTTSKQNFLFSIAFILMLTAFLPLVTINSPPYFRSHQIWTIIWGLSLMMFYPKIFFTKSMKYLMIYGLIMLIGTFSIWDNMDDWNHRMIFEELYEIAIGLSVITYFIDSKDYYSLAKLTMGTLVMIFITAIMTIIASMIDPMYARNMVSGLVETASLGEIENYSFFRRLGGGTYGTAGAFMALLPIFVYYYKNNKLSPLSKRMTLGFAILVFFALLRMQIFGNILIVAVFTTIALLGMKKIKKTILAISVFSIIIVALPKEIFVSSLLSIGNSFAGGSELNKKFIDLAFYVETGADNSIESTGTGGRAERYTDLIETFGKSPIFGCYFRSDEFGNGYDGSGAHLHWMNRLTITGISGFFIFLFLIPYNFIKNCMRNFNTTYKFYFLLASLSILGYGFIKVISGRETWYAFFILIPGLYYLPLLKKQK